MPLVALLEVECYNYPNCSFRMIAENSPSRFEKSPINLEQQVINFMGPEGSGKTTLAKKLSTDSGKPRLVYGDIFRDLAANDQGPHGDECRAVFEEHRYIKPEILFEIMVERFKQDDLSNGFILDGAMRTVGEVQGFQEMLDQAGRVMPLTSIFLRVPGWMGIERILLAKDRDREDDTPEAILSRLSHFYKDLGTRARTIREMSGWRLLHVNATGSKEETYDNVLTALL